MHTATHSCTYTHTNKNCQLEVLSQSPIIAQRLAHRYLKNGTWRREHGSEESHSPTALSMPHPGLRLPAGLHCFTRKSRGLTLASEAQPPTTHWCFSQCALDSSQTMSSLFSEHSGASQTSLPLPWTSPGWHSPPTLFFCLTKVCPALQSSSRVLSVQTQEVLAQLRLSEHVTQCAIVL